MPFCWISVSGITERTEELFNKISVIIDGIAAKNGQTRNRGYLEATKEIMKSKVPNASQKQTIQTERIWLEGVYNVIDLFKLR